MNERESEHQTMQSIAEQGYKHLTDHRIGLMFDDLRAMNLYVKDPQANDIITEAYTTYTSMLKCMAQGVEELTSNETFDRILDTFCPLYFSLFRTYRLRTEHTPYANTREQIELRLPNKPLNGTTFSGLSSTDLFNIIWTSPLWTDTDLKEMLSWMKLRTETEERRDLAVSAVMLGAVQCPDINKVRFLIECTKHKTPSIKARAYVGVLLFAARWDTVVKTIPSFNLVVSPFMKNKAREQIWKETMKQYISCADGRKRLESVNEKLGNLLSKGGMFSPSINSLSDIENVVKLFDDFHDGYDEDDADDADDADDEDYEEDAKTTAAPANDLAELLSLAFNGVDIYYLQFNVMYHTSKFFKTDANWFWPFTLDHPDIPAKGILPDEVLKVLSANCMSSDTDRFFLLQFFLSQVLAAQQKGTNVPSSMKELIEAAPAAPEETDDFFTLMRKALIDVYRYFKLRNILDQSPTPFPDANVFTDETFLASVVESLELGPDLARHAFNLRSYQRAAEIYENCEQDFTTLIRQGFCYQQLGKLGDAIEMYDEAAIFDPENRKLLELTADCCKRKGDEFGETEARGHLAELYRDNVEYLFQYARCLIRDLDYEEALKYLNKAYYFDATDLRVRRALAFCYLNVENFKKAVQHYKVLVKSEPTPENLRFYAHALWLNGDVKGAIATYHEFVKASPNSYELTDIFEGLSAEILPTLGKDDDDMRLMNDLVLHGIG